MSPTPTNDNVSEALLVEQARIDRDRIECMQADIKELQLALLQLSTEQTLLAMRAPTGNLGLWAGWWQFVSPPSRARSWDRCR